MASINLGRVGFVLRGTWSSTESYQPLDVVYYSGASYAARIANSGIAPNNSSTWQEMTGIASAVDDGISGAAVRYDEAQSLNGLEQQTARANIGAASQATVDGFDSRITSAEGIANIAIGKANAMEPIVGDLSTRMTAAEGDIDNLQSGVSALQTALNNKITVSGTTLVIL